MAEPAHREIAACDAVCAMIFGLFDAFPRLKDQVVDPMREEALASAEYAGVATADARGALVFRGPLKMLQTVAMVTQKSKAGTTADRFKPLASRCKWVPVEGMPAVLEGVQGLEGLQERYKKYDDATQFVAVVLVEMSTGDVQCQHFTATGVRSAEDRGPWEYVLDHGKTRVSERPKFGYNGSLVPYRVSPDRPVPDHIVKPDYYTTGQAEAERASEARNTPPVLTKKGIEKMRRACKLGRETLDEAHRHIKPGVTTDEIDRIVHDFTIEAGVSLPPARAPALQARPVTPCVPTWRHGDPVRRAHPCPFLYPCHERRHTRRRCTISTFQSRCARPSTRSCATASQT